MSKFNHFRAQLVILVLAIATTVGCSSKSAPEPIRSYAPDTLVQQIRFTVGLEIKVVDQTGNPVSGVRIYASNPYFHQFAFTGQSGTALIDGTFVDGEITVLEFDGPGIRWTEELHQELPARTKLITLKVRANGDGSIRLAEMRYFPQ
jgi:hypothetical protein